MFVPYGSHPVGGKRTSHQLSLSSPPKPHSLRVAGSPYSDLQFFAIHSMNGLNGRGTSGIKFMHRLLGAATTKMKARILSNEDEVTARPIL